MARTALALLGRDVDKPLAAHFHLPPTTLIGGPELAPIISAKASWKKERAAWESRDRAQTAVNAHLQAQLDRLDRLDLDMAEFKKQVKQVEADMTELKKQLVSHERMLSTLTAPILRALIVRSMADTFVPDDKGKGKGKGKGKPRSLLKAANDLNAANQDPTDLCDRLPSEVRPLYDPRSVAIALHHFDKATRNKVAHLEAEPAELFKAIICMPCHSSDIGVQGEAVDVHEHYGRCMAWVLGPARARAVLDNVERDPLATSKHLDNVRAYRAYIDSAVGPKDG